MTDADVGRAERDAVPTRAGLDRTAGLLLEGYPFLAERRRRWGSGPHADGRAVELRLLGERAVCVGGPEAVGLFYDPERFRRRDAIPRPLAFTLFGKNAVHLHDGRDHRQRKAMLLSLLDPAAARQIAAVADRLWQAAVDRWRDGRQVVVFDEAVRVLGVASAAGPACRSHPTTHAAGSGTWSGSSTASAGSARGTRRPGWPASAPNGGWPGWSGTCGPRVTRRRRARPWRSSPGTGSWTAGCWTSRRRPWSC
jgi:cytochrome P450